MMNEVLEAILFYDDLSSDQQKALFAALDEDPALARTFHRWRALQHKVHQNIESRLPNRELLVLHAVDESDPDALTNAERKLLEESRSDLKNAFEHHPGLQDVVKDIVAARTDFLSVWDDYTVSNSSETEKKKLAADRPPAQRSNRRRLINQLVSVFLLLAITTTAGILT